MKSYIKQASSIVTTKEDRNSYCKLRTRKKSIMGKPIPHLIRYVKVAPEIRKQAEEQKAAWTEADARKVKQNPPGIFWPVSTNRPSHSKSPSLSPFQLPTFPPALV
jgi:N-acetylmuramoyl-L-alanine amidase CwlA